jgi:hypothetical protein
MIQWIVYEPKMGLLSMNRMELDEDTMMQVDNITIEDESDESMSDIPLDKEIEELIRHCEELHTHHHTAIETLQSLHERLTSGTGLRIQTEKEDKDLGEYMEELHQQTMNDIQQQKSTSFYRTLLCALENTIIQ